MALLTWDKSFSVGISHIDDQHKHLIGLINKLHTSRAKGDEATVIRRVIFELFKYATHHFSDEEKLMRDNNFPGFQAHYEEHESFIKRLDSLSSDFAEGDGIVASKTFKFLVEWLLDHIITVDKQYGIFLKDINYKADHA